MKKLYCTIFILFFTFTLSCCHDAMSPEVLPQFTLRDIPWNSSPEFVIDKLALDTNEYVRQDDASYKACIIKIPNWSIYGESCTNAVFRFMSVMEDDTAFGLDSITLYFPDSVDSNSIKAQLQKTYGAPVTEYTLYDWVSASVQVNTYQSQPDILQWNSPVTLSECLTNQAMDRIYLDYSKQASGTLSRTDFDLYLNNPSVYLRWVEDAFRHLDTPPEGMTRNYLHFEASELVYLMQQYNN